MKSVDSNKIMWYSGNARGTVSVEKIKSDPLNLLVNTIVGKHKILGKPCFVLYPTTDKAFFMKGGILRLCRIQNQEFSSPFSLSK